MNRLNFVAYAAFVLLIILAVYAAYDGIRQQRKYKKSRAALERTLPEISGASTATITLEDAVTFLNYYKDQVTVLKNENQVLRNRIIELEGGSGPRDLRP